MYVNLPENQAGFILLLFLDLKYAFSTRWYDVTACISDILLV